MGLLDRVRERVDNTVERLHDRVRGDGHQPAQQPDAEAMTAATPEQIAQALELVRGAVADMQEAVATLQKKGGVLAAAKAVPEGGWEEAGKTIAHDGRFPAKQLCEFALTKYEQAAQLVDGIPEIEAAPEIKEGKLKEIARDTFGTAGTTGLAVGFAAVQITASVLIGFTPIGLAKVAVKRRRTKKAASNVDEMLQIMEGVRLELEQLNQRGMGGYLQQQG